MYNLLISAGKHITLNKELQSTITPELALEILKDGNRRFVNQKRVERNLLRQVRDTKHGQFPFAAIVSCIDSRIPTEMIFDLGIGDTFNARIAGNFVNKDILGSLEFACKLAGSKLIVVLGHTSCGAIKGACDNAKLGNLTQLLDKLAPAVNAVETHPDEDRSSKNPDFVNAVAAKNIHFAIEKIKGQSAVLNEMYQNGEIDIVGAMYDVHTGKVRFMA